MRSINEKARGVTDGTPSNLPIRVLPSPLAPLSPVHHLHEKSPVGPFQLVPVIPLKVLSDTPLGESWVER